MHETTSAAIAIVAAVINFAGTVPYIRDILRRKTKPERAMWWVYAGLFLVLFIAQADAQAGWLVILTAGYIASALIIALLSVWFGYGRLHARDVVSVVLAALGLLLWWRLRQPLLAILVVIGIDFAGFWLTLVKTWHAPYTETLISWQLSFAASVVGIFSVRSLSAATLAYPLYAILGTGFIVWLIMYRRTNVLKDEQDT